MCVSACECVCVCLCVCVPFGTQTEKRMRHIVIYGLSGFTIFFPHYLINGTIFGKKKVTEHTMCVLSSPTNLSETFLILRRNERDMIQNVCWYSSKVTVIFVRVE